VVEDLITYKRNSSEPPPSRGQALGDLIWSAVASATPDPGGNLLGHVVREQTRSRTRLIVLVKRPNKAVMALGDRLWAAEGVEGRRRGWRKSGLRRMFRTQNRIRHVTETGRERIEVTGTHASYAITSDLRQEPGAGKPHAGICAGGGE